MDARDWNASEALFAFLGYAFEKGRRESISFNETVQLMQTFSQKHNLPPTRDGWLDVIQREEG